MREDRMALNESKPIVSRGMGVLNRVYREDVLFPPLSFKHGELTVDLVKGKKVGLKTLRNTFNYNHFTEKCILVHLRHHKYNEDVVFSSYSDPCTGNEVICRLSNVHPSIRDFEENAVTIRLPGTSYGVGQRRARRYSSNGVIVELFQSGFFGKGELLDFSPLGFRIKVESDVSCSFHWLMRKSRLVFISDVINKSYSPEHARVFVNVEILSAGRLL